MLFELAVYVTGAMVAIAGALKTQPWKRFQRNTLFAIFVSLLSLISSALGGSFGIAQLGSGADKSGIWAAIIVCAILFVLNLGIFSYRVLYYYKSWKMIKENYSGFIIDDDLLSQVFKYLLASKKDILKYLDGLRAKTSPIDVKALKFLRQELQIVLIATLCISGLKGLRPGVALRLRSVAMALSGKDKDLKKYKFDDMPIGWELFPNDNDGSKKYLLEDINYRDMELIKPNKDMHQCDLCESYWGKSWSTIFELKSKCKCCGLFRTKTVTRVDVENRRRPARYTFRSRASSRSRMGTA